VAYKTGFGLDGWIYCTLYIHTVRDYRQYSAIAILHTFQFTVAHTLGFSVLTSRILATDLSQSHCHFKSHMKPTLHRLIPFLQFLLHHLRLQSPELDPILILHAWDPYYIASRRTDRKHSFLHCCKEVFTTPLHGNRRPIVERVGFGGICLPSRCRAMSTHVTILTLTFGRRHFMPYTVRPLCSTSLTLNTGIFFRNVGEHLKQDISTS
jgi:hypothetical protein